MDATGFRPARCLRTTTSGQVEGDGAHPRADEEQIVSEQPDPDQTGATGTETDDAATEAAQNVVDEVTTWEYSAEKDTIEQELDEGLEEAQVEVDDAERDRLVDEIDDVKEHEGEGSPRVHEARPDEA